MNNQFTSGKKKMKVAIMKLGTFKEMVRKYGMRWKLLKMLEPYNGYIIDYR